MPDRYHARGTASHQAASGDDYPLRVKVHTTLLICLAMAEPAANSDPDSVKQTRFSEEQDGATGVAEAGQLSPKLSKGAHVRMED